MAGGRHTLAHGRRGVALPLAVAIVFFAGAGCGSKISEPNYYRVQYGMSEGAVEELLGPPHRESVEDTAQGHAAATAPATGPSTAPATDRGGKRTVMTWTRGTLVISVVFEHGKVVSRRAVGGSSMG